MNDAASAVPEALDPPFWLRNRNLQSMLPSLALRRPAVERRCAGLLAASEDLIIDCGEGVRLLGRRSHRGGAQRLAVILHGWEGSTDSLYVLSLGQYLFERGFDVFRLNFRDHGPTHHLNRGIFHSCRLREVIGAIERIAELYPRHARSLVGFSLGGNFVLRVGVAASRANAALIERIVAISPVLDPQNTLNALERGWIVYRHYFLAKWRRSLRQKKAAWPDEFDFGALARLRGLTEMTEHLVLEHTDFPDLAAYLRGYAITGNALAGLAIPSRIFASLDDPIIPAGDYARIADNPKLEICLTPYGGHCGFRERLFGSDPWLERQVHRQLIA